jgi:hypothetical protein
MLFFSRNKLTTYILTGLLALSGFSCTPKDQTETNKTIAQVGNKLLTINDLSTKIPSGLTTTDSIAFVEDYIEKWIKQQLLVNEAESKLTSEEKDVREELEKYKEELLIFRYQSSRIPEIVERSVPYSEIETYYNANIEKFALSETIVRVNYLILPERVKLSAQMKKIAVSDDPDDIGAFEEYASTQAKKYENFNDNWVSFNNLIVNSKLNSASESRLLQQNKIIEFVSNDETHLLVIRDYKLAGETAPIDFVEPQIRYLLINKKKLDFLREIKDSLYTDALKYNKFRVFN